MQQDLISVIVPCYNMERFLPDCFASLDHQNYKNLEIIFVNDGSKDNTLQILNDYCNSKENCKVIDQQNRGLSGARNTGLRYATGKYVYFFDPDDFLSPNIISVLHKNLVENDVDISICRYKRVQEDFQLNYDKKEKLSKKLTFFDTESTICQLYSGRLFDVCVWNKLYKHEILKQIDNYPEVYNTNIKYGEDVEFNIRYLEKSKGAVFTKDRLYYYRQRKGSLVRSSFNEKRLTDFIGIDYAISVCENKFPTAEKYTKSWKGLVCIEMLFYIYKSEYSNKQVIETLLKDLKANMKYIVTCKRNHLYRRIFVPLTYPLFKLFLHKRLKTK